MIYACTPELSCVYILYIEIIRMGYRAGWKVFEHFIQNFLEIVSNEINRRRRRMSSNYSNGKIELIFGPMWSGKTTELMRRIEEHQRIEKKIVLIKWSDDRRYAGWGPNGNVVTHNLAYKPAITVEKDQLCTRYEEWNDADVIGIDEGHFFNPENLYEFCIKAAFCDGKRIIITGLGSDSNRKPFEGISNLIPESDCTQLYSRCAMCKKKARLTKRKAGKDSAGNQRILCGGSETYEPRCAVCFDIE